MDTEFDLSPDAVPVPDVEWDIRREGHAWEGPNVREHYRLAPEKIEMIFGQMFCSETERVTMLALLLENLGVDKAIRLGNPEVWRSALQDFLREKKGEQACDQSHSLQGV